MAKKEPDYQTDFVALLNNDPKARDKGFVVFVYGENSLRSFQDFCFQQSYNSCLTVRYRSSYGRVPGPLLAKFMEEVRTADVPQKSDGPDTLLGRFTPELDQAEWSVLRHAISNLGDGPLSSPEPLFSSSKDVLQRGERLVLFCELIDVPDNARLEDIGFSDAFIDALIDQPERLGLVFGGVPHGLDLEKRLENRFRAFEAPEAGDDGAAPQRSQKLASDEARGDDQLQIKSEVNALADAVLATYIQPPLVVGVVGGWGSGKSFVLHLLKERMRELRMADLTADDDDPIYVGHPYLIHFDAWTYAKSDLWASLMQRILLDLDQQLRLEQNLKSAGVDLRKGGVDIWDLMESLTDVELETLEKELSQKVLAGFKAWRSGKAPRSIWTELQKLRKEELCLLGKANTRRDDLVDKFRDGAQVSKAKFETAELEADRLLEEELARRSAEHDNEVARLNGEIRQQEAGIDAEAQKRYEQEARLAGWKAVLTKLGTTFGSAVQKAGVDEDTSVEDIPTNARVALDEVGALTRWIKGQSPASIAYLVVSLGAVVLFTQVERLVADVAGIVGAVGGGLMSLQAYLSNLNRITSEAQDERNDLVDKHLGETAADRATWTQAERVARVEPLRANLTTALAEFPNEQAAYAEAQRLANRQQTAIKAAALQALQGEHDDELAVVDKEIEDHVRRAGIPGQAESLHDLIRIRLEGGGYYEKRLGVVHQVQRDLQDITDALMPARRDEGLFPRGDPRIILIVDDLDRCPPPDVVSVLEAAQLLVKTKLFVVILAMDVRYITRCLEKEYEGILITDGEPSGLDYIEKIVQIPYRIRSIGRKAMPGYLRSQMKVRTPGGIVTGPGGDGPFDGPGDHAVIKPPTDDEERINSALPPEVQLFEDHEVDSLEACALAVDITPRSTKRLVNVLKLIKIIWYRRNDERPDSEVERAIVLLLALAARYPEVMRRLLPELQLMAQKPPRTPTVPLSTDLADLIGAWSKRSGNRFDWEAVAQLVGDDDLLRPGVTLEAIDLKNIELVRSFSFVGEVGRPDEPDHDQSTGSHHPPVTDPKPQPVPLR